MNEVIIWIKDIFIVILSITFIEILMPEGTMANYLKFIFSIIVLAVILSPVSSFPAARRRLSNTDSQTGGSARDRGRQCIPSR